MKFALEDKLLKVLRPHILKKPRLVCVSLLSDGTTVFSFLYYHKPPHPPSLPDNDGYRLIQFPDEERVEVEWPSFKDAANLDAAYINRRVGYQLIPNLDRLS
jgi:8-oxo-dGTP pyrophosphatase MutT (NUDIX family)